MNVSLYAPFACIGEQCVEDVVSMIKRQESQKAQQRRNARKQRARELTKARELEIKKGANDEQ